MNLPLQSTQMPEINSHNSECGGTRTIFYEPAIYL